MRRKANLVLRAASPLVMMFFDGGPLLLLGVHRQANLLLHEVDPLVMMFFDRGLLLSLGRPAGKSTSPWSRLACDDVLLMVGPCCCWGCTGKQIYFSVESNVLVVMFC